MSLVAMFSRCNATLTLWRTMVTCGRKRIEMSSRVSSCSPLQTLSVSTLPHPSSTRKPKLSSSADPSPRQQSKGQSPQNHLISAQLLNNQKLLHVETWNATVSARSTGNDVWLTRLRRRTWSCLTSCASDKIAILTLQLSTSKSQNLWVHYSIPLVGSLNYHANIRPHYFACLLSSILP